MHTLTCPCGAVELTVRGTPLAQFYCHCDDCRKMTSGAYAAESVYRGNGVNHTRRRHGVDAEAEPAPFLRRVRRSPLHRHRGTEPPRGERLLAARGGLPPAVPRQLSLRGSARPRRAHALRRDASGLRRIGRDGRLVTRVSKRADGGSRKLHGIVTIESLRPQRGVAHGCTQCSRDRRPMPGVACFAGQQWRPQRESLSGGRSLRSPALTGDRCLARRFAPKQWRPQWESNRWAHRCGSGLLLEISTSYLRACATRRADHAAT